MRILIAFIALILASTARSQEVFTPDQLKKDFSVFRTALEEAHPGLYRFRSKQEMDRYFAYGQAMAAARDKMDAFEFYRVLAPVVAAVGCGHTSLSMPETVRVKEKLTDLSLPLELRLVAGKMFVLRNHSVDPDFAPGTEIVTVDGQSIKDLCEKMLGSISGDGFIQTSRWARIERGFGRLLRVLYQNKLEFQFGIMTKGQRKEKKVVMAVVDVPSQKKPGLEYSNLENGTCVLTIRSFGSGVKSATGTGYRDFLAEVFGRLKKEKTSKLIIDLRENGGGADEYGALLFAYLTTKPFSYYRYLEMNKPEFSFLQYSDEDEKLPQRMKEMLDEKDGHLYYKASAHACLPTQQPQADHFVGKVIVLTDGLSFSATAEFASIAWFNQRATFVGKETGGAYEGNTSGGGVLVTLPESKLRLNIPMTKYACAVTTDPKLKGRGIIPHYIVEPTIEGLLSGKDEAMEKAKGL